MRTLGTRLRHLLELLDGDLEQIYRDSGLDYRPRYTPIVRALRDLGPSSLTAIAEYSGLTHSAVSQTVAQMKAKKLLRTRSGKDARTQTVALAPAAEQMLPALDAQWAATAAAAAKLDRELTMPLTSIIEEAIAALEKRPFAARIARERKR